MGVNIGFIGVGGIGNKHLGDLETISNGEVLAVCDVDEATATEAAKPHDASVYTDYAAMLEAENLDAVFVCLPPFAHGDPELAVIEAGCDLFVQKPLALSRETAEDIHSAIQTSDDIVTAVGYQWRYAGGVQRARELLGDRTIGYIEGYWWGGVPGGEDHWWRSREHSGGQIIEQATHVYDILRVLGGPVETVAAAGANRLESLVDFADVTSTTMEHDSGVISHVSTSCAAENGKNGLEVIAEDAQLQFNQTSISGVVDGEEVDEDGLKDGHRAIIVDFVDAVEAGDPTMPRSTYGDAMETFELTLEATEAIEDPVAASTEAI